MNLREEIAALEKTIASRPYTRGDLLATEWKRLADLQKQRADAMETYSEELSDDLLMALRWRKQAYNVGLRLITLLRDVPVIYHRNACEECGAPLNVPPESVAQRLAGQHTVLVPLQEHRDGCYQGRISTLLNDPDVLELYPAESISTGDETATGVDHEPA